MQRLKNKKTLIIIILVLACAAGFAAYNAMRDTQPQSNFTEGVNLNPPTQEELDQADQNKADNDKDSETRSENQVTSQTIIPEVTVSEVTPTDVEAAGVVQNIFEKDGTCIFIFSSSSNEVIEKRIAAVAEGRSTYCPLVVVSKQDFKPLGLWDVKIKYESSFSNGVSATRQLDVN